MLRVAKGTGKSLWQRPIKMAGRRKQAADGSPFLWILAFGEAKESISPSGARTRLNHASRERYNRITWLLTSYRLQKNRLVSGAQLQQAVRDLVFPEAAVQPVAKLVQVLLHVAA